MAGETELPGTLAGETVDSRTLNYNLPLPYSTNRLEVDVHRLMEILSAFDNLLFNSRVLSATDLVERRGLVNGWMGLGTKPLILTDASDLHTLEKYQATYFAVHPLNAPEVEFIGWIKTEMSESGHMYMEAISINGTKYFSVLDGDVWGTWGIIHSSANQVSLGIDVASALTTLGLGNVLSRLDALEQSGADVTRTPDIHNAGTLAGGQILEIDVMAHMDSIVTCIDTTATARSIRFVNIPDTTWKSCTWYVELIRGGTRPPTFTAPGCTMNWQGNAVPLFGTAAASFDQVMFEKRHNRTRIEMMLIKSGTAVTS